MVTAIVCGMVLITGCRTTAPMWMWRAPAVDRFEPRIGVAPVAGQTEAAKLLTKSLMDHAPKQYASIVGPEELEERSLLQLASYDGQPNELAAIKAAHHANCRVLMVGEVLQDQLEDREPGPNRFIFFKSKPPPKSITVGWKAIDSQSGEVLASTVNRFEAKSLGKNSSLLQTTLSETDQVIAAAASEAWAMVLPTLELVDVPLAMPTLGRDMISVYQGNRLAKQGLWDQAEMSWQNAASRYPKSKAAWHNLSMASVAKEDFPQARSRIRHADSWYPYSQAKSSMVWLERKQRAYHRAFNLSDPKEGWQFPDLPELPKK